MKRIVLFVMLSAALLFAVDSVTGQVGKETSLWNWTVDADHHESIVQVKLDGAMGTGVVILVNQSKPIADGFEGYCLTAYHVVRNDNQRRNIQVKFRNGRGASRCKVVQFDETNDVALLWVWVPGDIKPVAIASPLVKYGDELEFAGLGGGTELKCCLRHFSGIAAMPTNENVIYCDLPLLPGDSGGPVFNSKNELVGIISGGWFWWDGGVVTSNGNSIKATWPARASNTGPIQKLVATLVSD